MLDDLSGVPRYLQVARAVEREIRDGTWSPGHPIESRARLAARFGVAQMTAARAHAHLRDLGYVVAVTGVGMVVTPTDRWPSNSV